MKIISIILLLFSITPIFGQELYNLKTKRGQKTGKWIEHKENGSIKQVSFYEPYFQLRNSESMFFEAFAGQTDTVHNTDTIYYGEKLLWTEKYEYDAKDQLSRIIKVSQDQDLVFLYGPSKEISTKKDEFSIAKRVSHIEEVTMKIQNESDRMLTLTPEFDTQIFSTEQHEIRLPPDKDTSFTFQISIQPNDNHYIVTLKNDSISIDISVRTFGYNIESKDFSEDNQLTIQDNFVYWRTGDEALLRLYDKEKENIVKTFSLAFEKTTCDLKGIKTGDYLLCKRDFSTDQHACCKLKVEK